MNAVETCPVRGAAPGRRWGAPGGRAGGTLAALVKGERRRPHQGGGIWCEPEGGSATHRREESEEEGIRQRAS